MSRRPEVLWAQRTGKVYLTVSLPDARDVLVKCEPEGLFSFSAVGVNGEPFNFNLQLYGNIAPQGCKTKIGLRNIICSIQKEKKEWWNRLLKSEERPAPYIKVDWNKWHDEDDEDSDSNVDANFENGEDEETSDDEGMLLLLFNEVAGTQYTKWRNAYWVATETTSLYNYKDLPDLEKARGN